MKIISDDWIGSFKLQQAMKSQEGLDFLDLSAEVRLSEEGVGYRGRHGSQYSARDVWTSQPRWGM
jgi:hypothetical protein